MTQNPFVVVAGLGRCGSSLLMRMLEAGGLPVVGSAPDYEVEDVNHRAIDPAWLAAHSACALKVLNPHRCPWPAGIPRVVIWAERNPAQQARSQIKLLQYMIGLVPDRATRRGFEAGIKTDTRLALKALAGVPRLSMAFESLLLRPTASAVAISTFLQPWYRLDAAKMAGVVLPRSAQCAPDLAIEMASVVRAERSRG